MSRRIIFLSLFSLIFALAGCTTGQGDSETASNEAGSCVEEYETKNLLSGKDYVAGEIMLGFEGGSKEEAMKIIESHGFKYGRIVPIKSMPTIWIVALTDKGKEVEGVCKLRGDSRIKNADLNYIGGLEPSYD